MSFNNISIQAQESFFDIAIRTTVTKRAQTVVPAEIRARYGIKGGDLPEWIDDGNT